MITEAFSPGFERVVPADATIEVIATGFTFTEGPVWNGRDNHLSWVDIIGDTIYRWVPEEGTRIIMRPSGKANGMTHDREGRLVVAGWGRRTVWRWEHDGSTTTLASDYRGTKLNGPNDIVVKSDGAIYFSDPTYGRIREDVGVLRELQLAFRGVYRVAGAGAPTQLLADDFEQPNGLCFTLDEKRLFVNDTMRGHIRVFDVKADGTLAGGEVWAALTGEGEGRPDGMKLDSAGNLYCTGPGGVHVLDPRARCLGVIRTPERVTNIAWGDDDLRSLYLTGITSLYRVRVRVAGRLTY